MTMYTQTVLIWKFYNAVCTVTSTFDKWHDIAYELNLPLNMEKPHYRSQRVGEWSLIWAHDSRPIYRALTYIAVPLLGPHQPQYIGLTLYWSVNTLRPRQNGRHFADDMFKCIFLNENVWIPIEISLKFVPKGSINNNPALFQIMAWRRPCDKPLSEPMMVSSLTHICVTRPQWVNGWCRGNKWLLKAVFSSMGLMSKDITPQQGAGPTSPEWWLEWPGSAHLCRSHGWSPLGIISEMARGLVKFWKISNHNST